MSDNRPDATDVRGTSDPMEFTEDKVGAVIVAAGKSSRMGQVDKIFAPVAGLPVLAWVVNTFQSCVAVDEIVIVLAKKNLERGRRLVKSCAWSKVAAVCHGGPRRQDSVKEGLARLTGCQWVVIHDGARPCVSTDLLERGLMAAKESGAAIAGVPVNDTIKVVSRQGFVQETPTRQSLWAIQTPQVFRYDLLAGAHRSQISEVTDDATLLEQMGHRVEVYMGSYHNIKITTPDDLAVAELFLKCRQDTRPG